MKRNKNSFNLMVATLFVTINIIMASLAFNLKLPLFLDTLGTMLGTRLLGLSYGILIATASSVVNSFYDPFALPYLPTYFATAVMIYFTYRNDRVKKFPLPVKAIFVTIPSALVGGLITAYFFGGITSSGTSVLVAALTKGGFSILQASIIIQLIFEYIDKVFMMIIMEFSISYMPGRILEKFPDIL